MDGGGSLTREEIQGRNTWIVWTGGNDRFWDAITVSSFGLFDLLKIVSSHPDKSMEHLNRSTRWRYLGLVNEPCFDKPTGPDPQRYGLWLDKRRADCPPDPFENEQRYPGVRIGARGRNVPVGSYYGYASGIVGLRLFPNPDFDEAAAKKWDPVRYYTDAKLLRLEGPGAALPRRHVVRVLPRRARARSGRPPIPENPKWENLASNVGAQYFWVDRIFSWKNDPSNYMFQLLHTSRPGALDTSLVSTDYINNPRTMNAVYNLGPRLQVGKRWGKETLAGGGLNNSQFNDYVKDGPLTEFFQKPDTVLDPARPEGRLGLGGRPGRAQSRVPEHRPVQRGVAAALQRARRREADLADRDRGRAEELRLLAGHRGADAQHGALLPAGRRRPTD